MFHRHKWSDWAIVERGKVLSFVTETQLGSYFLQERYCHVCGKTQLNEQATGADWSMTMRRPDRVFIPRKQDQSA